MSSPLCYLCGSSLDLKRAANATRLVTKRSRHVDCYNSTPIQVRSPAVQEMLRACAEPSYPGADDEIEVRTVEIRIVAFLRFLGSQQSSGLASLPPELRIRIGKLFSCDSSARAIMLEYNLTKGASILLRKESPPIRKEAILLRPDATICIHHLHIDGRQYVVGMSEHGQTSTGLNITLASEREWTHLVLALDITGCRTVFLHPLETRPPSIGVWYRVIPRSQLATPRHFVCSYRGRTLRDMIDPENEKVPLFDSVPSFQYLRWFAESPCGKRFPSGPSRMMRRNAGLQITAVTAAFFDGTTVDLHFHRGSVAEAEAFYKSLDHFGSALVLRYAELRPSERLVNVGVRVRRAKLGCSSACLQFLTSEDRLIDLAPYIPKHMRAGYDLYSVLEQSGQVEAVFLNKRLDNSPCATVAVQTNELQVQGQGPAVSHWLSNSAVPEDEPPAHLQDHYMSVFRDTMVLEGAVDVSETIDQCGHRVCKGIRSPERILGLWKARTGWISTPKRNLQGCYLVNIQHETRWEVCIVWKDDNVLDGEQFLLWEGCKIVWWTGGNGNVVRVY